MSIFKDILNKLLHRGQAGQAGGAQAGATATPGTASPGAPPTAPSAGAASPTGGTPATQGTSSAAALAQVDVEAVMDKAAKDSGQTLNWRTSIVDTLKALGIDSSLDHRKALAKEMNYTGDMNDSAAMNVWLQKRVMQELAANGGKLPKELTD